MKSIKEVIPNYLFFLCVFVISLWYIHGINFVYSDEMVLLTNVLIISLSLLFMIWGNRYNFCLNQIFMLFSFFFFGIAPAIQYQLGTTLYSVNNFNSSSYLWLNVLILIIIIFYQSLYTAFSRILIKSGSLYNLSVANKSLSMTKLFGLSLFSLMITLYYNDYKLINLFFRGEAIERSMALDQISSLIYYTVIRPIPVICYILFKGFNISNKTAESFLLVAALASNFPTAQSRYLTAAMYIPVLMVSVPFLSHKMRLCQFLMVGLLFVFPILNQTRYISDFRELDISLNYEMFDKGHFDSYQMFMRVVDDDIVTMGRQLFTAVLFFVPRSIWPEKSVGSGQLVAEMYGYSFNNISMNFFGEGYINFGYFGVALFAVLIAGLNAGFDHYYWKNYTRNHLLIYAYYIALAMEFFILRGDLLSGIAYTTGVFSCLVVVYFFTVETNRERK